MEPGIDHGDSEHEGVGSYGPVNMAYSHPIWL